jgi:hypothetical protein
VIALNVVVAFATRGAGSGDAARTAQQSRGTRRSLVMVYMVTWAMIRIESVLETPFDLRSGQEGLNTIVFDSSF